jgi:DNA-binding ferritin-like protein
VLECCSRLRAAVLAEELAERLDELPQRVVALGRQVATTSNTELKVSEVDDVSMWFQSVGVLVEFFRWHCRDSYQQLLL